MTDEDSIFYVYTPYRFYKLYYNIYVYAHYSATCIYTFILVPIQTRAQLRLISHNKTI